MSSDLADDSQVAVFKAMMDHVDLHGFLEFIGHYIAGKIYADGLQIYLMDESESRLICEFVSLPAESKVMEKTLFRSEIGLDLDDISTRAVNLNLPIIIHSEEASDISINDRTRIKRWRVKNIAAIPMVTEGRIYGCLLLFKQEKPITDQTIQETVSLLKRFHTQVVSKLNKQRSKETVFDLHQTTLRNQKLIQIMQMVSSLVSPEQLYQKTLYELTSFFGFTLGVIALTNNERLKIEGAVCVDDRFQTEFNDYLELRREKEWRISPSSGAMGAVCYYNTPVYIPDVEQIRHLPMSEIDKKALEKLKTPRTMLAITVIQNNDAIGVMFFYQLDKVVSIRDDEIGILCAVGAMFGTAINNCKLYETVDEQNKTIKQLNAQLEKQLNITTEMARRDRLTDLYNFGFFHEELVRRTEECRRHADYSLSLIICDLDFFKKINDTYGHLAGNHILKSVAQILVKNARNMDIVCRYGGEEFVVILPQCSLESAVQISERIRSIIEAGEYQVNEHQIKCTASFGCAEFTAQQSTEEFVRCADEALYEAKESGRNCVKMHTE